MNPVGVPTSHARPQKGEGERAEVGARSQWPVHSGSPSPPPPPEMGSRARLGLQLVSSNTGPRHSWP